MYDLINPPFITQKSQRTKKLSIMRLFSVGLPAEIAARHKQYEYYRDTLLSFKEKVS